MTVSDVFGQSRKPNVQTLAQVFPKVRIPMFKILYSLDWVEDDEFTDEFRTLQEALNELDRIQIDALWEGLKTRREGLNLTVVSGEYVQEWRLVSV
jgi:hypothetical protein